MILITRSKTGYYVAALRKLRGEINRRLGQCRILCFQMKPDGFVGCRVAILTCSFIANMLAVTADGECCSIQSNAVVTECFLVENFEITEALSEPQA
jgi:hypothetical protein